jgi:predicted YcjX-like family ATPase
MYIKSIYLRPIHYQGEWLMSPWCIINDFLFWSKDFINHVNLNDQWFSNPITTVEIYLDTKAFALEKEVSYQQWVHMLTIGNGRDIEPTK